MRYCQCLFANYRLIQLNLLNAFGAIHKALAIGTAELLLAFGASDILGFTGHVFIASGAAVGFYVVSCGSWVVGVDSKVTLLNNILDDLFGNFARIIDVTGKKRAVADEINQARNAAGLLKYQIYCLGGKDIYPVGTGKF